MKRVREIFPTVLLIAAGVLFLTQFATLHSLLSSWRPYDYDLYISWGTALRNGTVTYSYPLPSIIWVFMPLSFLPDDFKLLWAAAPFIFVLFLFKRTAPVLWLYFPLLVQTAYGQLDGWTIMPLYWLVQDRPRLGPLGAVLLLIKPTLAPFTIAYVLYHWVRSRRWQSLFWFGGILGIYLLPAFIIEPNWVVNFALQIPIRATESNMIPRGASIWAWWWHGGITPYLFPLIMLAVVALALLIVHRSRNHLPLIQLIGLIMNPFLYASNFTSIIPLLSSSSEVFAITLASWIAVGVDIWANGWGGAYTFIPLAGLVLLSRRAELISSEAN